MASGPGVRHDVDGSMRRLGAVDIKTTVRKRVKKARWKFSEIMNLNGIRWQALVPGRVEVLLQILVQVLEHQRQLLFGVHDIV